MRARRYTANMNKITHALVLSVCLSWTTMAQTQNPDHQFDDAPPAFNYLVGRGMTDITGPVVGVQLWGFGRPDQIGEGLHIRLRSRAFVIAQRDDPASSLVFVSADLGSIDHHIVLSVLDKLRQRFGERYGLHNVIISATHTHAGPVGYWQTRSDTGLDGGFYPAHFEAIVAGITASIEQAHADLQPGRILINSGKLANAGVNRSEIAYLQNPQDERDRYHDNTNKTMTLLKFSDATGDIGVINWYALHPTAMNYYNHLISGDHKGYASLQMERQSGVRYSDSNDFVAAFAQSDPGDVTPNTNLDNTGPGKTDVETTQIMGERQLQMAQRLFDSAAEALQGPIDARQIYVNFNGYEVADRFTGSGTQHTCPSAYGYSFAGGSTEDGGGHFMFREGMTEQKWWMDQIIRLVTGAPAWTEAVKRCQAPKAILFETGSQQPPLQSQIHTVTVARIGQLVILAMPGEVTTMAGRRLRDTVMAELGDRAQHIVIAGYANEFAGYVTTPEEYLLQQYEAAHNLHGRWSLPAYQQVASQLAAALMDDRAISGSAVYDDWRGQATALPLPTYGHSGDHHDMKPGSALPLEKASYGAGETVTVEFRSIAPTEHYVTGNNFLQVQQQVGGTWRTLNTDTDWQTRVRWRFNGKRAIASLEWDTTEDTETGNYRLQHTGFSADGTPFSGSSDVFSVNQPAAR